MTRESSLRHSKSGSRQVRRSRAKLPRLHHRSPRGDSQTGELETLEH